MNALDLARELEVWETKDGGVEVTIPLAEPPGVWVQRYGRLAQSKGIPVEVREEPGGIVLRARVPAGATREETFRLLSAAVDAAVELIARAKGDESNKRASSAAAEGYVRDWWSTQRH